MFKVLFLIAIIQFTVANAEEYFLKIDHHKTPHQISDAPLTKFFSKGRVEIFKVIDGEDFDVSALKNFQKIKKDSWKVIGPESLKEKLEPNPKVVDLISKLDASLTRAHLEFSVGQLSRRSGAPGNQNLTKYILDYLKKYDYQVEKDCFSPGLCNVFGTIEGEIDEYVLIEAHLDSVGRAYAGADDNASGVAGLLELARLLSEGKHKRGLIIFATNGEESGLIGSKDYVSKIKKTGFISKIKYVLNMDMIGYNKNGIVDIETNKPFEDLAIWKSKLVNTYTSLKPEITMPAWGSDHVPFLQNGVPSILTIEHWKTKNPCYHRDCDQIELINFEYMREIIKLNIASSYLKLNP